MSLNDLSRILYRLARGSRDLQALSRGPSAVGRRIVRKAAGRTYGRLMRRWLP